MSLVALQKPGRKPWYIRGTINGVRYDESTGTTDRGIAEQYRVKRENEIHRASIYGAASVLTFSQAVINYVSRGGSKRYLKRIVEQIGDSIVSSIDQDMIDRLAIKLYPHCGGATRNRQVYTPIMAVLHANKISIDVDRPKQVKKPIEWVRREDATRFIAAASKHTRPLYTFLFFTGCRSAEALFLDWSQVDLARRHVTFHKTKNGDARGVPLHPLVITELEALAHRAGPVFLTPKGKPYKPLRVKPDGAVESAGARMDSGFRAAAKAASLGHIHPHMTRHSWATWHYMANRDIGALMRLGGWKSEKMVLRYVHVNVDELAATIGRL